MEGNVGVAGAVDQDTGESFPAPRMSPDNGCAGAAWQPAGTAFPKAFAGVIRQNES
jgi:hypothetical protein